jgi:hypothetical protein
LWTPVLIVAKIGAAGRMYVKRVADSSFAGEFSWRNGNHVRYLASITAILYLLTIYISIANKNQSTLPSSFTKDRIETSNLTPPRVSLSR